MKRLTRKIYKKKQKLKKGKKGETRFKKRKGKTGHHFVRTVITSNMGGTCHARDETQFKELVSARWSELKPSHEFSAHA